VAYPEQVEAKAAHLAELFQLYWGRPIEVTGSPEVWNYRNKVDLNFAGKHYETPPPKDFVRETMLGFKKKGQWYWPLDIDDCLIGPEELPRLMDAVRGWVRDGGHVAFDSRRKRGLLQLLLVRVGVRTGERMVVLMTRPEAIETSGFVEAVDSAWPGASIQHAVSRPEADAAFFDVPEVLRGSDVIHEALQIPTEDGIRELRFRISPLSFFQTNTLATEILYSSIRGWVEELRPPVLYDLYGGSGGIALTCSDLVERVESVESIESATIDGNHNAASNKVENVSFSTAKVERYLQDRLEDSGLAEGAAVVVDPPRGGMVPKAIKRLLKLRPRNILYVSCKPEQLAREELPVFLEAYELTDLWAVDLFPHTAHVEAVAALQLRE
jgi:23S rRNA (uracil1939-C5)-methyltransferase